MYAIIDEGGKQFKVTSGDTILIDRPLKEGEKSPHENALDPL